MKSRGLAKAQFIESYNRTPWNSTVFTSFSSLSDWPSVEYHLSKKRLSYFDYLLTQRLLRNYPQIDETVALFFCHLIKATKEGHLCVKINELQLVPTVWQLWSSETECQLTTVEGEALAQLIKKGERLIPADLITETDHISLNPWPSTPLCRYKNSIYLQRHWVFESQCIQHFHHHLCTAPTFQLKLNQVQADLQEMQRTGELNAEQSQAVLQACQHSVSLITGGPGTGKSYTAGKLIGVIWSNLSPVEQSKFQIVLTAPTGKAVANLQKSLEKLTLSMQGRVAIQAKTLHALLNIRSNATCIGLTADLIVVDECSMIDAKVMARLFEAVKRGARLVLLGDPHQLPAVEAGNVFVDLNQSQHASLPISRTHLKTCLRAELQSIIEFAQLVKEGDADQALAALNQSAVGVNSLKISSNAKEAQKELISYLIPFFPKQIKSQDKPESLLQAFNTIRLLSPVRKGLFGVDTLNQLIWQAVSQQSGFTGWLAIPILIVSNDYRQDLFNGETGVLLRKLPLHAAFKEDYALFPSRREGDPVRRFPALLLPRYELAYCLSVHKSQGSEFDRVILALPEEAELFGREIFYTAITRARKQIEIFGNESTLRKTILHHETRLSNIPQRFALL